MDVILVIISIASILMAIKKYVDALIVIHIMQSHGVEPQKDEIRKASTYVIKKLLKL